MDMFLFYQELQGEETREDQGSSIAKVMCRICFSGETEGSDKAGKMLSCKICDKKYHRNCLKSWAEYRGVCFKTQRFF